MQIPIHSCSVWSDIKPVSIECHYSVSPKEGQIISQGPSRQTATQSIYVDDVVTGAQGDEEALLMYKQSKDLFKAGGFNLRKFVTNVRHLQEKFDQEEGVANKTQSITGSDETYTSSALGTMQISIIGEQKVLAYDGM